ncbi:MAG: class A beta-lactamase [Candidatus Solibacter sp.]|nr:class A beta-lactamase [Candidatus Solibacter sp.]
MKSILSRRQCLPLLAAGLCPAADSPVSEQWRQIATETDGMVGAAALHLGSGRRAGMHGSERFPLASVCKLPIAVHILAMVDEGRLALDEELEIPRYDVWPGVSLVAEKWSRQHRFRLDELLEWMVAKSDNTAVQTLFRIGGGGKSMAARFRQWQIAGVRLDRSERQCGLEAAGVRRIPPVSRWTPGMNDELAAAVPPEQRLSAMRRFLADPRDTATPEATVQLLQKLFAGQLLSPRLTARMAEILKATTTGNARIKGLLPAGTVVAHKTGTTATAGELNGATNDAGVILLPDGAGQLAIAVYVKGSTRDQATRERVIARIAKAAFDSWSNLA